MKNKQNLSKIFLVIFSSLAFLSFGFFVADAEAATNPTEYVSLRKPFTRAPEDKEYWSFSVGGNHSDYSYKFMSYYRGFIPPGTVSLNISTIEREIWEINAVARHNKIPYAEPISGGFGEYYTLSELEADDCFVGFNANMSYLYIAFDGFSPPLEKNRAGWLYIRSTGGESVEGEVFSNSFSVLVDTKTYNAWWDTYIKDSAGWENYVESVETYVDPTITNPPAGPATGPDCAAKTCKDVSCDSKNGATNPYIKGTKTKDCATVTANVSPKSITPISETPPSEVTYMTWSTTNAKKLEVECSGITNILRQDFPLNSDLWETQAKESGLYTRPADKPKGYPGWFHVGTSGTEKCTFYPTNATDGLPGTPFTVQIEVRKPNATPTTPKPADCVTLHAPYTRAPDNVEYYSFAIPDTEIGYLPYFRAFVPPGTVVLDLLIIDNGHQMAVARHKLPPTGLPQSPPNGYQPDNKFSLQELIEDDQWPIEVAQGYLYITHDSLNPPAPISDAGWLYAKVDGGQITNNYFTTFSVRVDTATYNAWWDTYIKDATGWEKYVESVETYLDPTTTNPTRTSNVSNTNPDSQYICQPDNPGCEKTTCKNVQCNDGCNKIQGLVECDGLH